MEQFINIRVNQYKRYNSLGIFTSASMMFYVIQKAIYNGFASIDLQYDIWSIVDVIVGVLNICVLCFFQFLDIKLVTNETTKEYLSWAMLITTLSAWVRLCFFVLVIESYSNILMTIYTMIASASNFLLILLLYLFIMSNIFMGLF